MLKAGGIDMKIEYGKVIESFYWACKANKQMICNDAKPNEVLASVKDASCKAWKLKLSGKESVDPTTLIAEEPVPPQRASDTVSFKNPDEILEELKEELAGKTPLQIKELKITIANLCRSQALAPSTCSGRGRSSCNIDRDRQLASGNDGDECMPATGGSGKNSGSGRNASKGARQSRRHKKSADKNGRVPSDR